MPLIPAKNSSSSSGRRGFSVMIFAALLHSFLLLQVCCLPSQPLMQQDFARGAESIQAAIDKTAPEAVPRARVVAKPDAQAVASRKEVPDRLSPLSRPGSSFNPAEHAGSSWY
ncbi:hypothetical protein PGT21_025256 [Puccinia graminis f. sp. tritici]|uniref:Transmembrane protein n=1 Tax=Puccinia graminis f. sp. tritici TaxID=56615 RepID=A0A5B0N4R8_PUCGR|nr:hypothetical protein PGT21_025256 [Puccinia graminis f. sp. tritici]KAA1123957.1 hypothetical protein PGTUg99_012201 [Puccinia graminis f. sp. tritici]